MEQQSIEQNSGLIGLYRQRMMPSAKAVRCGEVCLEDSQKAAPWLSRFNERML